MPIKPTYILADRPLGLRAVTYAYGTTLTIPEPASIVGLAVVAVLACRRRLAA
jgi:hypothetical protein